MSFTQHFGNLRIPTHPIATPTGSLWNGYIDPEYYYLYTLNDSVVISNKDSGNFGASFYSEDLDMVFTPVYQWLNGFCYFASDAGWYLWYTSTIDGWVITNTINLGIPPREIWDTDSSQYYGDTWYSSETVTGNYKPRGDLRGNVLGQYDHANYILVDVDFEKYYIRDEELTDICGVYVYQGTEEKDDIIVGLPQFKDAGDVEYIRSLEKTSGKYTYGTIRFTTKWIIGTENSSSGWWEGSEPDIDNAVTFIFTKPDGSDITGENKIISFDKYVLGENTLSSYGFNVGKWHT